MRLSTSQYQKHMHTSYHVLDIVDFYADFRSRDEGYLYWTHYFGETPKWAIAKFGMKQ